MQDNPHYFKEARDLDLMVIVWTINKLPLMEKMVDRGATHILTDIPHQAKQFFEQRVYRYSFEVNESN
jgi:glycerophosphoryl diester phosphodiesterase